MKVNTFLCAAVALIFCFAMGSVGAGAKEIVLHSFSNDGNDGADPFSALIMDEYGNLYGTTVGGGAYTEGTVFKLAPDGTESILHAFDRSDGRYPSDITMDRKGNIYGTTYQGGNDCDGSGFGCGVVYKLAPNGKETVLHAFAGRSDGANPQSGPIRDKQGDLFGTTLSGGADTYGPGVVYKVAPDRTETVLHIFAHDGVDGYNPQAGLVMDQQGNLYGTTLFGGPSGDGVIFKVTQNGVETVLHAFSGQDGNYPQAGLTLDKNGNLYGATADGGAYDLGTIYKLTPSGKYKVLHSFGSNRRDGRSPEGRVVVDKPGNIYGTTYYGGANGSGAVFELTFDGTEILLHSFSGDDGESPAAKLILDSSGVLYGTTRAGGAYNYGTVFKIRN